MSDDRTSAPSIPDPRLERDMHTARQLVETATNCHPHRAARVGMRSGMGDASALCDAIAADLVRGMRPSKRRDALVAVAKRCGDAIFAMRDLVEVPDAKR